MGGDETVKIWDLDTAKNILRFESGCGVTSLACLRVGLASGTKDKLIRIIDLRSGRPISNLQGHDDQVSALARMEEPGLFASGAHDGTVKIWDTRNSGTCLFTLPGHTDGVSSVACVGPHRVAAGSLDGVVRIWDTSEGICLAALEGHEDAVTTVAMCSPGYLVSGSKDTKMRIWSANTGRCKQTINAHGTWVAALTKL